MTSSPDALALPAQAVADLLQSVVKAQRAFAMYLPNNPVYHRAADNVKAAFQPVWGVLDELALVVSETAFVWEEQTVYEQASKSESLAWVLYKDGMRALTFRRGVEDGEMVRFLEIVNRVRRLPADASDDLLTLLWEQEFDCIQYRFIESFGDEAVPEASEQRTGGAAPATAAETREAVREEAPPKPGIVDLEDFDSTLYFLDEAEIAFVTDALRQEYERDVRSSALLGLFDVFEREADREVRDEVLGIVETLLPNLIAQGEFRTVAALLRELRTLAQRTAGLAPAHAERLQVFERRLSEPEIVRQLLSALDEAANLPSDDDLTEVLRELQPQALGPMLAALPTLQNPRVRKLVEQGADRLAAAGTQEVLRLLRDPATEALAEIVGMCGRLKLQGAVPGLGDTLGHADAAVRLASVQALAEIASPGALQLMERAIDDADRGVRLAAVRALGLRGYKNALRRIEPVVLGKSDRVLDLTEKMAFFEAFGAIAGPPGIPPLQSMLLSKGLFGYKANPETRACAAVALGRIRTPDARAALQKAADDKELVVRNAVSRALRGGEA